MLAFLSLHLLLCLTLASLLFSLVYCTTTTIAFIALRLPCLLLSLYYHPPPRSVRIHTSIHTYTHFFHFIHFSRSSIRPAIFFFFFAADTRSLIDILYSTPPFLSLPVPYISRFIIILHTSTPYPCPYSPYYPAAPRHLAKRAPKNETKMHCRPPLPLPILLHLPIPPAPLSTLPPHCSLAEY